MVFCPSQRLSAFGDRIFFKRQNLAQGFIEGVVSAFFEQLFQAGTGSRQQDYLHRLCRHFSLSLHVRDGA